MLLHPPDSFISSWYLQPVEPIDPSALFSLPPLVFGSTTVFGGLPTTYTKVLPDA